MSRTLFFLLTVALLFGAVASYRYFSHPVDIVQPFLNISSSESDFQMENSTSVQFDELGFAKYQLKANTITTVENDDTTYLVNPYMTIFRQDGMPWHINAETGEVLKNQETILLKDNVIVRRVAPEADAVKMETEFLTVYPKKDFAETDLPVVISTIYDKVDAIGMKSYFKEERIELLNDVRGYHEVRNENKK